MGTGAIALAIAILLVFGPSLIEEDIKRIRYWWLHKDEPDYHNPYDAPDEDPPGVP